ncbi:MAG: potassium channel family protein [Fibrobacterota bacterium]
MAEQIIVIGLGQFGMALARSLSGKGAEVLGVDKERVLVDEAASFLTETVAMDATDEAELARLKPKDRDSVICAIGDESKEASIICTALLRQMGTPMIVSRAGDKTHQRILKLVGAHQVINPEEEFGKKFANRIIYRNIIANTNIGEDLSLTEIKTQPSMAGKNLIELSLPGKYGVIVAGIRSGENGKVSPPSPTVPLKEKDNLILVSNESSIQKLIKEV